jgi:hypothetical protein
MMARDDKKFIDVSKVLRSAGLGPLSFLGGHGSKVVNNSVRGL